MYDGGGGVKLLLWGIDLRPDGKDQGGTITCAIAHIGKVCKCLFVKVTCAASAGAARACLSVSSERGTEQGMDG